MSNEELVVFGFGVVVLLVIFTIPLVFGEDIQVFEVVFLDDDFTMIEGNATVYEVLDSGSLELRYSDFFVNQSANLSFKKDHEYRMYYRARGRYTASTHLLESENDYLREIVTFKKYPSDLRVQVIKYENQSMVWIGTRNTLMDTTVCTEEDLFYFTVNISRFKDKYCYLIGTIDNSNITITFNNTNPQFMIVDSDITPNTDKTKWSYLSENTAKEDIAFPDLRILIE